MVELLENSGGAGPLADPVRVVPAGEVAALRRSLPDSAIVALVGSRHAGAAVEARLAGADVVLPGTEGAEPDPADLALAVAGAHALAASARRGRDQTRAAAHEFAGTASAVAMVAHLLGPQESAERADQLRRLGRRGQELAWRAGRVARSAGMALEIVDLAATVDDIRRDLAGHGGPEPRIDAPYSALVIADRQRLAAAVRQLLDNARRAEATTVTVRVVTQPSTDAGPGWASVTVEDDGPGLPEGWALKPFVSGWSPRGDGLGLAEAAEFADDHRGALEVESRRDGPGVRATLRLPVIEAPQRVASGAPRKAAIADHDGAYPDRPLASILEGIARRVPLGESLEQLVAVMERHLPASVCSILLLDEDTGTLRHGAGAHLPAPYRAAIDGLRIGPLAGSCGTAAYTRTEVVVTDVATDERWNDYRHFALPFGLRACWSRPIIDVDRGAVLGTFAVYHGEPWRPGPSAVELVRRLTHVAAVAIGTAALHGQLVESEARFRSTFEAAGMGIALVSPTGTVQEANAALTAMAGRAIVGVALCDLLVDDDAEATGDALKSAIARPGGDATLPPTEVRLRRPDLPDAEPIWAAMSGSLIRGPRGEPRHFCIELFDLTERRRVAEARREREAAEAADRAKSELLTLVSHEARTPLHAVMGFAQVLKGMRLPPERQREAIDHILGAGQHLLQLINDLLDITGAEAGQLHLDLETLPASDVVAEAMQIVAGLADERSISLRANTLVEGVAVRADRQRLRQVLLNLLGNAIKFTAVGGAVQVVVGADGMTVCDTGGGIPAESLPLLFTPFHRGGNGEAEGSGLGLAVSQRLMRAMDGDLRLVTTTSGGTTFRLTLPSGAGTPAPQATPVQVSPPRRPMASVT